MKLLPSAAAVLFGLAAPTAIYASPLCPALGNASAGCDLTITITDSGTTVGTGPSAGLASGTYDGSDDTLIGIVNNSSVALSSIDLSSPTDIFGFDGDGIVGYGSPGNLVDGTGYGGPNSFFTNIHAFGTAGTVDFITALAANGGNTYIGLEDALSPTQVLVGPPSSVTPEPGSLVLLGTGMMGLAGAMRRRFVK